jgi:hypothetical protein
MDTQQAYESVDGDTSALHDQLHPTIEETASEEEIEPILDTLTGVPFSRMTICVLGSRLRSFYDELMSILSPSKSFLTRLALQSKIKAFEESITDFEDLPRIMALAMAVMGLASTADSDAKPRVFAQDVFVTVIKGPTRPQLNHSVEEKAPEGEGGDCCQHHAHY